MNILNLLKAVTDYMGYGGNPNYDMYIRIRTRDRHDTVKSVVEYKVSDFKIVDREFKICAEETSRVEITEL